MSATRHKNSLGTVLVRFERSPLPEHIDTRAVVLRILQALTPIQCTIAGYDSHIKLPVSGSLLNKTEKGRKTRPWSMDLACKGQASRLLSLLWPSSKGKI